MADLWLPASACPHRLEHLRFEIKTADQAVVQCFGCKSVWSHETVPLAVLETLRPVVDALTQSARAGRSS